VRVLLVTGICVEHDAISGAVIGQADALNQLDFVDEVMIAALYHERATPYRQVTIGDSWSLANHESVRSADVVVFHWGIHYGLFDSLPLVAARTPTFVHFHNVTPAHMVQESHVAQIELSIRQIQLAQLAEVPVWTESEYNMETLLGWGFRDDLVHFMPFPVERPARVVRKQLPKSSVQLLAVGRLVEAKGVHVLIDAVRIAAERLGNRMRLAIVGSTALSDPAYSDRLRGMVEDAQLTGIVEIIDSPDDEQLCDWYRRADVLVSPSFHEGLCVPVIEAYRAGCRVIGTDAGNLPYVVQPPDPVVASGDAEAMAAAIVTVADQITTGSSRAPDGVDQLLEAYSTATTISQLRQALEGLRSSVR
jgi:glycosyltransferase involved in cell wall biosynthesis